MATPQRNTNISKDLAYEKYVNALTLESKAILLVEFQKAVDLSPEFRSSIVTPFMREVIMGPDQTKVIRRPGRNKILDIQLLKPGVYGTMTDLKAAQDYAVPDRGKRTTGRQRSSYWRYFVWDRGIGLNKTLSDRITYWSRRAGVAPTLQVISGKSVQNSDAWPRNTVTYDFEKEAKEKVRHIRDKFWSEYLEMERYIDKLGETLRVVGSNALPTQASFDKYVMRNLPTLEKIIPVYAQYTGRGRQMYFTTKSNADAVLVGFRRKMTDGSFKWDRVGGWDWRAVEHAYSQNVGVFD